MKTISAKPHEVERSWCVVDASGQNVGRLASRLAHILRGKHKPEYTPHVDVGDYIIVLNANKVAISGNKAKDKQYYRHSGYPGGIKQISFDKLLEQDSRKIIMNAVKGMLPKTRLGRSMIKKLKVYVGVEHPHEAQQPQKLEGF